MALKWSVALFSLSLFRGIFFSDYKEYHTDVTVKFVLNMTEDKLAEAEQSGLHKKFKLESTISTSNMVSFMHLCSVVRAFNQQLTSSPIKVNGLGAKLNPFLHFSQNLVIGHVLNGWWTGSLLSVLSVPCLCV